MILNNMPCSNYSTRPKLALLSRNSTNYSTRPKLALISRNSTVTENHQQSGLVPKAEGEFKSFSWSPHLVNLRLERLEIKFQQLLQGVIFVGVQRITQLPGTTKGVKQEWYPKEAGRKLRVGAPGLQRREGGGQSKTCRPQGAEMFR